MAGSTHTKFVGLIALGAMTLLGGCSQQAVLLHPAGAIGVHEKDVILTAFGLMLIVVIPVFVMTFLFAWRYRASNKKATYAPDWDFSLVLDLVVWIVPALIVIALGTLAWRSTHALSPYRPLASTRKALPVEVVAMDWKWLFIYPRQHIASVNQLVVPAKVPVDFRLTSDTVMTSFFIPRLGTQIYAMGGMQTKLHLLADKTGTYIGRNFQFDGRGYSDMRFKVIATTAAGFRDWVNKVKQGGGALTFAALRRLERPSIANPVVHYGSVRPHLFEHIIGQYARNRTGAPRFAVKPKV